MPVPSGRARSDRSTRPFRRTSRSGRTRRPARLDDRDHRLVGPRAGGSGPCSWPRIERPPQGRSAPVEPVALQDLGTELGHAGDVGHQLVECSRGRRCAGSRSRGRVAGHCMVCSCLSGSAVGLVRRLLRRGGRRSRRPAGGRRPPSPLNEDPCMRASVDGVSSARRADGRRRTSGSRQVARKRSSAWAAPGTRSSVVERRGVAELGEEVAAQQRAGGLLDRAPGPPTRGAHAGCRCGVPGASPARASGRRRGGPVGGRPGR